MVMLADVDDVPQLLLTSYIYNAEPAFSTISLPVESRAMTLGSLTV